MDITGIPVVREGQRYDRPPEIIGTSELTTNDDGSVDIHMRITHDVFSDLMVRGDIKALHLGGFFMLKKEKTDD